MSITNLTLAEAQRADLTGPVRRAHQLYQRIREFRTEIDAITAGTTTTTTTHSDPGDGLAIPVTAASGFCAITTAGAETRTLAIPTSVGQRLQLVCDTYVGNCVITVAQAFDQTGNTTITMNGAGDFIELVSVTVGAAYRWRVVANDGCGLT